MNDPIVVVGGGVIGSSCAGLLAQEGIPTVLIRGRPKDDCGDNPQSAQDDGWDSRTYALNQKACNILEQLGVTEHISRQGVFRSLKVWNDKHHSLNFAASDIGVAQLGVVVEHSALSSAIDTRLQDLPQLTSIEKDLSKLLFSPAPRATASLELDDGEFLQTPLVIGADGSRSIVRESADIASHHRSYHQTAHVAVLSTEKPHHDTCWQRFSSEQGVIALLPLADHVCSAIWSHPDTLEPEQFEAVFSEAMDLGKLELLSEPRSFPLQGMLSEHYIKPACALIGDAAHCVHPLAGQGANLGFRDIACLLDALQRSQWQIKQTALRRYQRSVKGHNAAVKTAIECLLHLGQKQTLLNPCLWQAVCACTEKNAYLRSFFIQRASGMV